MEDNFLYDDLGSLGDLGELIHSLEKRKNDLELNVTSVEGDVKKLCDKIKEMKAVQNGLSRNITDLFKTAKRELNRKDGRIAELQAQLDDILHRGNSTTYGSYKRKREEHNLEDTTKRSKNDVIPLNRTKSLSNINYTGSDRDNQGMNERLNSESNSYDSSKHESVRSGKTSHTSVKPDRAPQGDDSRKSILDDVYRDENSPQKYDRRGNSLYSREQNNKRDNQRHKWDTHRNNNINTESRFDRRDSRTNRRDHRPHFNSGHRESSRGHRDRSRDSRNNKRDYQEYLREHRDYQNDNRDTRREDTRRMLTDHRNEPVLSNNLRSDKIDDFNCFDDEPNGDPRRNLLSHASEQSGSPYDDCLDKEEGEISEDDARIREKQDNRMDEPTMAKLKTQKSDAKHQNKEIEYDSYNRTEEVRNTVEDKEQKNEKEICSVGNIMSNKNSKLPTEIEHNKYKGKNRRKSGVYTTNDPTIVKEAIQGINNIQAQNIIVEGMKPDDQKRKPPVINNRELNKQSDQHKDNVHINIIHQVVLNEAINKRPEPSVKSKPTEPITNQGSRDKPSIILPKLDKPKRESRVPRNLTEELNINLDRSAKKQKLMSQIFGSCEKKNSPHRCDPFSPSRSVSLSHEGEIPNLDILSVATSREMLNQQSESSTNPVKEFQIFKTNLPSLEKSNSLPSIDVHFQAPDNSSNEEHKKLSEKTKSSSVNNVPASVNFSETLVQKKSTASSIENALQCSDVCDVSFDLLNMDIRQCKVEDFPNLIAASESKDMSDLLLTPVESIRKNMIVTKKIISPIVDDVSKEIILKKLDPTVNKQSFNQNELKEHPSNIKQTVSNAKSTNQNSNKNNTDKKKNQTEKNVPLKTISKSSKKNNKKNKIDKDIIIFENVINEKIDIAIQKFNNKKVSPVESCDKIEKTEASNCDISDKVKDSTKETRTGRNQKQNKTNNRKITENETSTLTLQKPVNTGNQLIIKKVESSADENSSKDTKNKSTIDRRRKRCGVKWV